MAQRSILIEALLESDLILMEALPADFSPGPIITEKSPSSALTWAWAWGAAARTRRWSEVVPPLIELKLFALGPAGKPFPDCAFIVIAERLLRVHLRAIEVLRAKRYLSFVDMIWAA